MLRLIVAIVVLLCLVINYFISIYFILFGIEHLPECIRSAYFIWYKFYSGNFIGFVASDSVLNFM